MRGSSLAKRGAVAGGALAWSLSALAASDWGGHGHDGVGLYAAGSGAVLLSAADNQGVAHAFGYGPAGAGWIPVAGDWDGDGIDTLGLYDPASGVFHLRNSHTPGNADIAFAYGPAGAGWLPLAGDWDGDGLDSVGLFDPIASHFHLTNARGPAADHAFAYGPAGAGWVPIAGDWDGDGVDTAGLYDPLQGVAHLNDQHEGATTAIAFRFGPPGAGWLPITGDWNGNGVDSLGLYDQTSGIFHLKNDLAAGNADLVFRFGTPAPDVLPIGAQPGARVGADEMAMLHHVNATRAEGYDCGAHGIFGPAPALTWNGALASAAARHSFDMAQHGFVSHTGSDGSDVALRVTQTGYDWWTVGENLAAGYWNPAEATAALLSSPPHCAAMMDPDFAEIGVARAVNLATPYRVYWTQVFGASW
jgi:uncharacterized protein YkwD